MRARSCALLAAAVCLSACGFVWPAFAQTAVEPRELVLPGAQIPGDWELVDEQSLRAGDQQLELYHELNTDSIGRIVGLSVARFDDPSAAATAVDRAIVQARNVGRPGWTLDDLGDGPAVVFVYRVAETDLRARFGFAPDALGETVMVRLDRYVLTVQVGGPSEALDEVDSLAARLTELQLSHVQSALGRPTAGDLP